MQWWEITTERAAINGKDGYLGAAGSVAAGAGAGGGASFVGLIMM
jgi:hypothetical protein